MSESVAWQCDGLRTGQTHEVRDADPWLTVCGVPVPCYQPPGVVSGQATCKSCKKILQKSSLKFT